jgi:hypothetical protein
MEVHHMQSNNHGKRDMSVKEIASMARRRETMRSTLKAAMTGGMGLGIVAHVI